MRKQKARCDVHQTAYKSRQHSSAYFFFIFVVVVVVNEFEQKKINIDLNWNCLSVVWMSVDDWKNASYLYDYIYILYVYLLNVSLCPSYHSNATESQRAFMNDTFVYQRPRCQSMEQEKEEKRDKISYAAEMKHIYSSYWRWLLSWADTVLFIWILNTHLWYMYI